MAAHRLPTLRNNFLCFLHLRALVLLLNNNCPLQFGIVTSACQNTTLDRNSVRKWAFHVYVNKIDIHEIHQTITNTLKLCNFVFHHIYSHALEIGKTKDSWGSQCYT